MLKDMSFNGGDNISSWLREVYDFSFMYQDCEDDDICCLVSGMDNGFCLVEPKFIDVEVHVLPYFDLVWTSMTTHISFILHPR